MSARAQLPEEARRHAEALLTQCAEVCARHAPPGQTPIATLLDAFFGFLDARTDFFEDRDRARDAVRMALERSGGGKAAARGAREADAARARDARAEKAAARAAEAAEAERARVEALKRAQLELAMKKSEGKLTEISESAVEGAEGDAAEKVEEDPHALKPGTMRPNRGNGGEAEKYVWTQTLDDLELRVAVPPGTKAKQVRCEFAKDRFSFHIAGAGNEKCEPIIEGEFHAAVSPDDCYWTLEDNAYVSCFLQKAKGTIWWPRALAGDPEIDTTKVEPENSRLADLDGDTRATVEKMMYDQRQKALGLPTADEQSKRDSLKAFIAAHPEMDFSNARFDGVGSDFNA